MCKWICPCFYGKEEQKAKKKGKDKGKNKGQKDEGKSGKSQSTERRDEKESKGWALEIESFYDTKGKESVNASDNISISPSELPESEVTHTYELPFKKCNTIKELLIYLGYEIQKQVGKGGFGQVHKCYSTDKISGERKVLAVKEIVLTKREKMIKGLKSEIFILKRCKHPYIIRLEDNFIVNEGNRSVAFIFMEFADGDTLQQEIDRGPIPNAVAKRYFAQMSTALVYLHRLKIAHKDLKPENILMVTNKTTGLKDVRVADFGLSQNVYKHKDGVIKTGHFGGTRGYMAPEILRMDVYREHRKVLALFFDPFKSDMWALGVCLYEMLTKNLPFDYHNLSAMLALEEEKSFSYPNSVRNSIDPKADDLIRQLLEPDVNKRIDPLGVLTHPWIKDEVDMSLIVVDRKDSP